MRHIGVSHLYIQELVKTKQVIIGKVDGKENTLDILTKHLATAEQLKTGCHRLGLVDLSQESLDEHVSKVNMKTIGAETQTTRTDHEARYSSKLSIRQHEGMTPLALYDHTPGDTGLKGLEIGLVLSWTFNPVGVCIGCRAFCYLHRDFDVIAKAKAKAWSVCRAFDTDWEAHTQY